MGLESDGPLGGDISLAPTSGPSSEAGGIWGLIGCVLFGTLLVGVVLGWSLHSGWSRWYPRIRKALRKRHPWEVLTTRVLRYIHKRRVISIAFHNLGHYSLRNSAGSQPNQLRRRRAATPGPRPATRIGPPSPGLTPLQEGPVIQHGPDGARA